MCWILRQRYYWKPKLRKGNHNFTLKGEQHTLDPLAFDSTRNKRRHIFQFPMLILISSYKLSPISSLVRFSDACRYLFSDVFLVLVIIVFSQTVAVATRVVAAARAFCGLPIISLLLPAFALFSVLTILRSRVAHLIIERLHCTA